MPKAEKLLWQHLRDKQLGYKFRRQFSIGPYTADFYCPLLHLVVEVDGLSHHTEEANRHDKKRDVYMESLGLKIKRYTGGQVWNELDSVKQSIINTCKLLEQCLETSSKPPLTPPS